MLCQPGVRQCVAVVRQGAAGDRRLVAYVVADAGSGLSADELRRGLKQRLPEYMVPADYLFLEALPLTPNGKVDRQSLPPPVPARAESQESFVAARSSVEEVLAEIWPNYSGFSVWASRFFHLGGHSLLATRMLPRVREVFHVELPLHCIFQMTTVEKLAQALISNESKRGQTELIAQVFRRIRDLSSEDVRAMLENRGDPIGA